jgi:pentatricopeptide repeat domain-containing protein 1
MFSAPNRCQQYKRVLPATYIVSSPSSTTNISEILHTDYNNNFKCRGSNNNKKHQEKIYFNQPQSAQIYAKTHLKAEMNFSESDPDTFGDLKHNKDTPIEAIEGDEDDKEEEVYLEHAPTAAQKLSTKQYATIIKDFITRKKVFLCEDRHLKANTLKICSIILTQILLQVADAIDVLETRMLKQDRVKPENFIYNLIIGECGRLGYTKKAFQLYNQVCFI